VLVVGHGRGPCVPASSAEPGNIYSKTRCPSANHSTLMKTHPKKVGSVALPCPTYPLAPFPFPSPSHVLSPFVDILRPLLSNTFLHKHSGKKRRFASECCFTKGKALVDRTRTNQPLQINPKTKNRIQSAAKFSGYDVEFSGF